MENNTIIQALNGFIDRAEKLGKYPANSAGALRSTVKLVGSLLTDEEPSTLDYLREHIEEIVARSTQHSAQSIHTYIGRAKRVMEDFQAYGSAPSTILN